MCLLITNETVSIYGLGKINAIPAFISIKITAFGSSLEIWDMRVLHSSGYETWAHCPSVLWNWQNLTFPLCLICSFLTWKTRESCFFSSVAICSPILEGDYSSSLQFPITNLLPFKIILVELLKFKILTFLLVPCMLYLPTNSIHLKLMNNFWTLCLCSGHKKITHHHLWPSSRHWHQQWVPR